MKFEIDVSGDDIFHNNFTICVAEKDREEKSIIKGFKFKEELIQTLISRWEKGQYKYSFTENKRGLFKVRLYCIVLYYLFREINIKEGLSLTICRDFKGHENDITLNLKFFLGERLGINLGKPLYQKLPQKSKAHWYAYLMSKDSENLLNTYVKIEVEDIELFLKRKEDLKK